MSTAKSKKKKFLKKLKNIRRFDVLDVIIK